MPLTARQFYDAATISSSDFGVDVVAPELDEEGQLNAALAYIDSEVIPGARSEISIPFRNALGEYREKLDDDSLRYIFGEASYQEVIRLWNLAEISYGRSELNKRIDSNATEYDKDSDQDRIQGNQRLQKLLDFVANWKKERDLILNPPPPPKPAPVSHSRPIVPRWY